MRWYTKLAIAVAGGVLAVVLLTGGAVLYTNRSDFCVTCHYMQPYYDAWLQSSHRDVPCAQCHYAPGATSIIKGKIRDLNQLVKYATNTYRRSKPWAEIEDASCLREGCHDTRVLEGQVEFRGVKFDHGPHLTQMRRGKKLRCTSCHSQIVQGEHMSVTSTTCVLCHFKERGETDRTASCTLCHDPPQGADVKFDHTGITQHDVECRTCHGDMIVGDGDVPREQCYACHYERERLDQYDNHELMHRKHITENKIECERCHYPMAHKQKSAEQRTKPDCNTCHLEYHNAQVQLFAGNGGLAADSLANPMFESGLSCQSCHRFHEAAPGFAENGTSTHAGSEACEACHGEGYARILAEWKNASAKQEGFIESTLTQVEQAFVEAPLERQQMSEAALEVARHDYLLVKHGKSVHNMRYANRLMVAAYDSLQTVMDRLGGAPLPEMIRLGDKTPGECSNCHVGIEYVDTDVFGIHFEHERHVYLQGLPCTTCHSNMRRHGELVVTRQDCLSCHHKPEASCGSCHKIQDRLRRAEDPPLPIEGPDMMEEAGVHCNDCHENEDGTITKVTALRCVNCHDADYAEILDDWQAETRGKVEVIERDLLRIDSAALDPAGRQRYDEIAAAVRIIRADKSDGVHNHEAINELLDRRVSEVRELVPESGGSR